MTFTSMQTEIADRLNLTSTEALARIGRSINERYRWVCTSIGMVTSGRDVRQATVVAGSNQVTFTTTTKVMDIFDNFSRSVSSLTSIGTTATATVVNHPYQTGSAIVISGATETEYNGRYEITVVDADTFTYTFAGSGTSPATGTIVVGLQQIQRMVIERTFDQIRSMQRPDGNPFYYAVYRAGASTVTVQLDRVSSDDYILNADVMASITDLAGSDEPAFSEDYHDVIVYGAMATELEKMEKYQMADRQTARFEERLSALRMYNALSSGKDIMQGSKNFRRAGDTIYDFKFK